MNLSSSFEFASPVTSGLRDDIPNVSFSDQSIDDEIIPNYPSSTKHYRRQTSSITETTSPKHRSSISNFDISNSTEAQDRHNKDIVSPIFYIPKVS